MAINKAKTSVWMKAILILIIIAFVTSFVSIVASPFTNKANQNGNQSGQVTDSVTQINSQYQPQVQALTGSLQSDPTSYTALVNLGNAYFDWAAKLQQASQTATSAVGADAPMWVAAKDAYGRAVKVKPGESPVEVDYAIATFYSGDTNSAIALAEGVTKRDAKFAPAWFNLGIFYETIGTKDKAIAAYEQYLKLDPDGKQGNPQLARQNLEKLKSAK